jgi:hypothetical protein
MKKVGRSLMNHLRSQFPDGNKADQVYNAMEQKAGGLEGLRSALAKGAFNKHRHKYAKGK